MEGKENPAPVATGSAEREARLDGPKLLSKSQKRKAVLRFVAVCSDDSEVDYATEPRKLLTLRVERDGEWEYTRTWNRERIELLDCWPPILFKVPPPGRGWIEHNAFDGCYTVWRRKTDGGHR